MRAASGRSAGRTRRATRASIGSGRSLPPKLSRRMIVSATKTSSRGVFRPQTTVAVLDRTGRLKPTFTLPRFVTFR
jgi:hypothetical protein